MTPQQAYEKRHSDIDNGQHTWEAAPPHVKEMWLAAWTIAWVMAEAAEREACAQICAKLYWDAHVEGAQHCESAIRARGEG